MIDEFAPPPTDPEEQRQYLIARKGMLGTMTIGNPSAVREVHRPTITVLSSVYHRIPGEEAGGTELPPFMRRLVSDEQPYVRKHHSASAAQTDWRPLDLGWLGPDNVGLVVLSNDEGRYRQAVPSPDQQAADTKLVIELGIYCPSAATTVPFALVPANEAISSLTPSDASLLRVRCPSGPARYTLSLYPK